MIGLSEENVEMTESLKVLYQESVASQIKVWDDEIEHLDARADIIMAQTEDKYYNLMKCLRAKENELKRQLAALESVGEADEGWQELRSQLACTTRDMRSAISKAAQEIEPGLEV
jgi:hypothetical protein